MSDGAVHDHDAEGLKHLLIHDHHVAWKVAAMLWTIAGLLFVAMAIPPLRSAIDTFDREIYDATFPIKWAGLTAVAHALNILGSGYVAWPLRLVVTGALVVRRRWEGVAAWLAAIAITEPFIWLLKTLYGRPRPPESLVETTSFSFPSGHAIGGAVIAIGLVIVLVPAGPARRNLELVAAGFAVIMGGSRVYLGAHWLTDTIAGVAFGAAGAIVAATVVHRWFVHRLITRRREAIARWTTDA